MQPERHVCTAEEPWNEAKHGPRALHPDAKQIDEDYDSIYGCYERYECPHCGKRFWLELPD